MIRQTVMTRHRMRAGACHGSMGWSGGSSVNAPDPAAHAQPRRRSRPAAQNVPEPCAVSAPWPRIWPPPRAVTSTGDSRFRSPLARWGDLRGVPDLPSRVSVATGGEQRELMEAVDRAPERSCPSESPSAPLGPGRPGGQPLGAPAARRHGRAIRMRFSLPCQDTNDTHSSQVRLRKRQVPGPGRSRSSGSTVRHHQRLGPAPQRSDQPLTATKTLKWSPSCSSNRSRSAGGSRGRGRDRGSGPRKENGSSSSSTGCSKSSTCSRVSHAPSSVDGFSPRPHGLRAAAHGPLWHSARNRSSIDVHSIPLSVAPRMASRCQIPWRSWTTRYRGPRRGQGGPRGNGCCAADRPARHSESSLRADDREEFQYSSQAKGGLQGISRRASTADRNVPGFRRRTVASSA
jgi:hypothetical protein